MEGVPRSWGDVRPWLKAQGLARSGAPLAELSELNLDALSERLGRAQTILLALDRLRGRAATSSRTASLNLLVLGPDAREGSNEEELARTFEPLACAILSARPLSEASPPPAPRSGAGESDLEHSLELHVCLVGPNVPHVGSFERLVHTAHGRVRLRIVCVQSTLHDERCAAAIALPRDERFACAFAFNAGIWGYESWALSLAQLGRMGGVPLVVTSYNELEADEDAGALEDLGLCETRDWHWQPELNPFAATREWRNSLGRTATDNGWWQCVDVDALGSLVPSLAASADSAGTGSLPHTMEVR